MVSKLGDTDFRNFGKNNLVVINSNGLLPYMWQEQICLSNTTYQNSSCEDMRQLCQYIYTSYEHTIATISVTRNTGIHTVNIIGLGL